MWEIIRTQQRNLLEDNQQRGYTEEKEEESRNESKLWTRALNGNATREQKIIWHCREWRNLLNTESH